WEMMCQSGGRLQAGETIEVEPGPMQLCLLERTPEGHWLARPAEPSAGAWHELLQRHGRTPLPPYIRKGRAGAGDSDRYQTVYAREAGAVAAPTAGLHFTRELFERLRERGVQQAFVTLHVGLGTFQPIQTTDFTRHAMHREWGELPAETAAAIEQCRGRGG